MHAARSLISAVPVVLALAVPATAAAAPADLVADASAATTIKLNSVTSPPRAATAGQQVHAQGQGDQPQDDEPARDRPGLAESYKDVDADPRREPERWPDPRRPLRRVTRLTSSCPARWPRAPITCARARSYGKRSAVPSTACRFSTRRIKVSAAQTGAVQAKPGTRDRGRNPTGTRRRRPVRRRPLRPRRASTSWSSTRAPRTDAIETSRPPLRPTTTTSTSPRSPRNSPRATSSATRRWCSSTRPATCSTPRSRARSRPTTRPAAASSRSAPRSAPSPAGRTWTSLLGTRAAPARSRAACAPRSRSPTASTTRARPCPSTGA